jgi:predicted porin
MNIRKKLLWGTIGLAACGVAHAQTVEVYGLVFQFLDNAKTSGATSPAPSDRPNQVGAGAYTGVNDPAKNRLSSGTSNLGFRGSEDLGGGLKAVWQLESAFQVDQNTGPGWAGRNSMVGLQGKWGTVNFGQWDTPYKFISLPINALRIGYQADYTPIMGNPGFGVPATTTQFTRTPGKPDAAFDRRQGNAIQYWSPTMGGFSGRIMYSVNEGKTAASATAPSISPTLVSLGLAYDIGNLSLRYAYEQHDDYFGMSQLGGSAAATLTNTGSKDKANKVIAQYRFGSNTRLAGIYEQLDYRNDDSNSGAVSSYKRNAYYVFGEQKLGAHAFWAAYGRADDGSCGRVGGASCSTRDIGADYVSAGWVYNFSKRTQAMATYYKVNNKASGTYTVQPTVGGPIAPGADTTGFGAGIAHFF